MSQQVFYTVPSNRSPCRLLAADDIERLIQIPFNLVGDNVVDDGPTIQQAITQAEAVGGGKIYLPQPRVAYRVNNTLLISSIFIVIEGASKGTTIYNHGAGATFKVTSSYAVFKNLAILGLGDAYGVGAPVTDYGVELIAGDFAIFDTVKIGNHGNHGIYNHGGGNTIGIYFSDIRNNAGSGIYSVTLTGAEQNGNAMRVFGTGCTSNGGDGITWSAASLTVEGCNLEANIGAGVAIDSTGASITSKNATICGNYMEQNRGGQVTIRAGAGFFGGVITGNYLRWGGGFATTKNALIHGSGAGLIQLLEIGTNTYTLFPVDPAVPYAVNLSNRSNSSCTINQCEQFALFTALNTARVLSYFVSTDIDTSAKLRAIVTDETGTGSLVFGINPQFGGSIGIGGVASGSSSSPLNTYSNSNGTTGPTCDNASGLTSAASAVRLSVGGILGQIAQCNSAFIIPGIAGRLILQPPATGTGVTAYVASGQVFDVQASNVVIAKVQETAVAGETALLLYDTNSGLTQRVKVGAAGTGPAGVGRALYLP